MRLSLFKPRPEPEKPPLLDYDIEVVPRVTKFGIEEKKSKHHCLCGALHVVTGTKIWAMLGVATFWLVAFLIFNLPTLQNYISHPQILSFSLERLVKQFGSQSNVSLGFQLQYLISIFCAILAMNNARQSLLWPFMINSIIVFYCLFYQCFMETFVLTRNLARQYLAQGRISLSEIQLELIEIEIILFVAVAISYWQMKTVLCCKRYFADRSSAKTFQMAVTTFVQQLNQVNNGGDSPPPYECNSALTFSRGEKILV